MPFSTKKATKKQQEWRKKRRQEKLKALKAQGLSLLPKRTVRRLATQGIDVVKYLRLPAVSRSEYEDLKRTLAAKQARIEWQSGGIKMLHDEIATLKATTETMKSAWAWDSEQVATLARRVTELEAEMVVLEADAILRQVQDERAPTPEETEAYGEPPDKNRNHQHQGGRQAYDSAGPVVGML